MLTTPSQGLYLRLLHVANGLEYPVTTPEPSLDHMTVVSSSRAEILWPKEQGLLQTPRSDMPLPTNDALNLGPVEKAVFQQAMYNQSKKKTPAMRRCDDCNVIFNSQVQAEMHYKGKKHARIMYLKRSRERKISSSRASSYLANIAREGEDVGMIPCEVNSPPSNEHVEQEHMPSASTSSTSPVAGTNGAISPNAHVSFPTRCCIRYANPNIGPLGERKSPAQGLVTDTSFSFPTDQHPTDPAQSTLQGCLVQPELKHPDTTTVDRQEGTAGQSELQDDASQSPGLHAAEACDDDKAEESAGPPQREPVILPDPLPSYIKKVERPAVLKESLRCNVCDIYVNSENQMRQHVNSLRHKNIEQGIPTPPKPGKEDKPKTRAEQFKCEVCKVTLNSDIQLLQHLSSQRHKNMLEGKPPKPRWTPYERAQQAILRSAAQLRLPFKTIPNTNQSLLTTPAIPGTIPMPALPVVAQPALQNTVLSAGAPTAHLKQTAFIGPNGSLYQTREIVYLGAPTSGYPGAYQQQIGTPGPILGQPPLHLQQPCDLTHLLGAAPAPVSVDQGSMGI